MGSTQPWIIVVLLGLFTTSVTVLGMWLTNKAQKKGLALQARSQQVSEEQHLIELLQVETTRLRDSYSSDLEAAKTECNSRIEEVRTECHERLEFFREQLKLEQEAHDRTRHRYLEDMNALQSIVRDEITRSAAALMSTNVRDLMDKASETRPRELLEDGDGQQ